MTETDKAVEALVSSRLKARYPDFDFMGEETYAPGQNLTAAPTFVVDPIDGTTVSDIRHSFLPILTRIPPSILAWRFTPDVTSQGSLETRSVDSWFQNRC